MSTVTIDRAGNNCEFQEDTRKNVFRGERGLWPPNCGQRLISTDLKRGQVFLAPPNIWSHYLDFLQIHDILRCFSVFCGVLWRFVAFCCVLWRFAAFYGVLRQIGDNRERVCGVVLWHFAAFCGVLRPFTSFCGVLRHFCGVLRLFAVF